MSGATPTKMRLRSITVEIALSYERASRRFKSASILLQIHYNFTPFIELASRLELPGVMHWEQCLKSANCMAT